MVTTSREDRLMRKAVTHSPISTSKKNPDQVDGNWHSSQYKNNSAKVVSGIWPQIMQTSPKTTLDTGDEEESLDFANRHASCDLDIKIKTFSVYKNVLILVFHNCIVHSCFANLHFLRDLMCRKL